MIEPVELSDGFVTLAPQEPEHLHQLFDAIIDSREDIYPWLPFAHANYSKDETREWLAGRADNWDRGNSYEFAILDASDKTMIGGCGLNNLHEADNFANLGYWVRSCHTKRGVATAAVRLIARFGFDRVKLTRAEIVVSVENKASLRVAAKAGATREGILRNWVKVGESIEDAVMFSLIPEDFAP